MRKLTSQQAKAEYQRYCDLQQQGTDVISFQEYVTGFKIQILT